MSILLRLFLKSYCSSRSKIAIESARLETLGWKREKINCRKSQIRDFVERVETTDELQEDKRAHALIEDINYTMNYEPDAEDLQELSKKLSQYEDKLIEYLRLLAHLLWEVGDGYGIGITYKGGPVLFEPSDFHDDDFKDYEEEKQEENDDDADGNGYYEDEDIWGRWLGPLGMNYIPTF